jgi:hypothetical protein
MGDDGSRPDPAKTSRSKLSQNSSQELPLAEFAQLL